MLARLTQGLPTPPSRVRAVGAIAWLLAACASGETSINDSASFGPGGNGTPSDPTVPTGDDTDGDTDGADGNSNSNGNSNTSATNGNGSADTVDPDCEDEDGDDYGSGCAAGEDCDDADPEVNPGMAESCDGVDQNCDSMIDNGCECPDDGISGNCNMPTDLGMLIAGENKLGIVGNIPTEDSIDWYVVHFPTAMRPGEGTPTIGFSVNEGDAFVFDVVTGQCEASGATCTSGGMAGAAIGLTTWTFVDDDPGCCTAPMDSLVPWPNDLYLRVYRTSPGASCAAYQLQLSR
jgi:hypothetical protein